MELISSITKEIAESLIKKIANLNESASLALEGPGGMMKWAFAVYDALRDSKYPVTGVVTKDLYSAGVMILQACEDRHMKKGARLGFHNLGYTNGAKVTLDLMRRRGEYEAKMLGILTSRSGCSLKEIRYFMKTGRMLSAEEALQKNLIDKIV